jgi:tetratricopeptide (TPR) repeat protein
MLSSRNIHFVILGIILGAASGYIFAFYHAQGSIPAPAPAASSTPGPDSAATPEHPDITDDQMLELFNTAIEKNPNNPELMTRYANFLFDLQRYNESVDWYQKVLALQPSNIDVRTDLATALYSMGRIDESLAEYQKSLAVDPRHMLSLHNLVVLYTDSKKDFAAAESVLKQMEEINPNYEALPSLRTKLAEDRARAGR